jgi:peptidoglycan/xylan/chitin deacetylase (PgdA/CDA1 family)
MRYWFAAGALLFALVSNGELQGQSDACGDSVRVPILVYHKIAPHQKQESAAQRDFTVSPEAFARQLAYLRTSGIAVIPLGRLVSALEGGDTIRGPAVVITFDDGLVSQYEHAFPLLRQFGYVATFFVYTNPLGRNAKWLTWEQLAEMSRAGMTIGSHTRYHPWITKMTDAGELQREIAGSREQLQTKLGITVEFFAYPFGVHTPAVAAVVRESGYRAARAYPGGVVNTRCDLWTLRSTAVTEDFAAFRRIVQPR